MNINALGHRRDRVYDDAGRLRFEVDELGYITEHRYDGLNQKTHQVRYANAYAAARDAQTDAHSFDALNAFILSGDAGHSRTLRFDYDARGQLTATTASSDVDDLVRTQGITVNAFGEQTEAFTVYEGDGEPVSTVTTQSHLYNVSGQLLASRDAEGYITVYTYNGYGELSSERQLKARYVQKDANGQVMTDDAGQAVPLPWNEKAVKDWADAREGLFHERRMDYAYDNRGNRQQVTLKDVLTHEHRSYMEDGVEKSRVEEVRGDLITTTYHDHAGRMFMTVQEAAPSTPDTHLTAADRTLYEYDALGRLVTHWSTRKDYVVSGLTLSRDNEIPERLSKHQRTDYLYDAQGNQLATLSEGRRTYQYYDADGKMTARRDAEGNVTTVEVDDMNRILAETRDVTGSGYAHTQRTEYLYDDTGRQRGTQVSASESDTLLDTSEYNAFGEITAKVHNGVVQETYHYDGLGRVESSTVKGVSSTYAYNWLDNVTLETVAGTRTTTRAYDQLGNQREERGPAFDGKRSETAQTFDRWGNVLEQTMNGKTHSFKYNHANQVIRQMTPEEVVIQANGDATTERTLTLMHYDRHGNRLSVKYDNGAEVKSYYDLAGQKLIDVNGQGGKTHYYHNIHGEMVGRINVDGQGEVFRYDNNGQLLTRSKIDNAKGYLEVYAKYAYDQAGQRYHEQWFGGAGYEIYTQYDAAGRVTETQGAGQHKRYTYDSFGNKKSDVSVKGDGSTVQKSATFDAYGRQKTETLYDGSVVTYHYDQFGQLDEKTGAISIDYDYWENGLLKHQTTGSKTESYHYNADGKETRRALLDSDASIVTTTQWDALGRLKTVTSSDIAMTEVVNEYKTVWEWRDDENGVSRRVPIQQKEPDIEHRLDTSSVSYFYDAVGNRRKITTTGEQNSTRWYHYDKDNRMVGSHTRTNDVAEGSIGNRAGDRKITYTASGQKETETRWDNQTRDGVNALVHTFDEFDYDSAGHLNSVKTSEIVGSQSYVVRRMSMDNYKTGHADVQRDTVYTYAYVNGQVSGNATESKTTETEFAYSNGRLNYQGVKENGQSTASLHFDYHVSGQLSTQRTVDFKENATDTLSYTYTGRESFLNDTIVARTTRRGNGNGFRPGTTTYQYNSAGQLTGVASTRDGSERKNLTDFNGQIAVQRELENNTLLAKLTTSGNPLATITKGDVDADLLDDSGSSAGQQPGTYTVGANDTLQRISQMVYGDSRYWYLIADANGLSPTEPLTEGKLLVIPNQHTQTFNGAESFKPYNESEILGNVNPDPIPNPPPKKSCSPIAMIVMAVVAVVVTIYTAGAAAALFGGVAGTTTTFGAGLAVLGGRQQVQPLGP